MVFLSSRSLTYWGVITFTLVNLAADWPRFRGPNGTGVSEEKNIPVKWSKENILWSKEVLGAGNSSPIISKGKLFLQSASTDQTKRFLHCFDAKTGELLWSKESKGGPAKMHKKNTLASSTPAADGEQVYAIFWDGVHLSLTAWDYDGNSKWTKDLGGFRGEHGPGLSPMVVGNRVILNNDQGNMEISGPAEVQAFDTKTGEKVWYKSRTAYRCCYSTPFVLEKEGKTEVVLCSSAGVASYNPTNGEENWSWTWAWPGGNKILRTVGSPLYHNGIIVAYAGEGGMGRSMVALKADGKGDVTKTNLIWQKKKGSPYVPTMLAKDGYLYWVTDVENLAVCVDIQTGEEKWSERLGGGNVSASPILIDDKIYTINEQGTVHIFKASPKSCEILAKNEIGEQVYASPAVADGKLYIRGQKKLYCIGKKD